MYNFFIDVWIWSFAIFGVWKIWDEMAIDSIVFFIKAGKTPVTYSSTLQYTFSERFSNKAP